MFKLIRDNIPTIITKDGGKINYAAVQDDDFFKGLLRGKLVEELNEYFSSADSLEELVDVITVINYIIGDRKSEFDEMYAQKLKEVGGFDKRYIAFFQDEPTEDSTEMTAMPIETTEETN
jgi:predicted house-cleaning noncanonical NTP pyrophosphatase (MazG superfamily)